MQYYYDWAEDFSTDPRWNCHRCVKVLVGGVEKHNVIRCLTGQNGFVFAYVVDEKGALRVTDRGEVETELLPGVVCGEVELIYGQ